MNRIVRIALVAAALVAAALPYPAQARCHGCGAAAVVGGFAAGALIGSALAGPHYVEPAPVYDEPPPVYVDPPEYDDGPVCHSERQQIWDGYAWRNRRVEVCD